MSDGLKCPFCNCQFSAVDDLATHMRTHKAEAKCPTRDTATVRAEDVEFRFFMRDEIGRELADSVGEHGILEKPLIMTLTDELKKEFRSEKPYLCID